MLIPLDMYLANSVSWSFFALGPTDRIDWQIFQQITQQTQSQTSACKRNGRIITIPNETSHQTRDAMAAQMRRRNQV